jgi:hypothetical protein
MISIVIQTVQDVIVTYITNEIENIDIFSFEADTDSKSRAKIYIRLARQLSQKHEMDLRLVYATDKWNSLTEIFLIKNEVFNKLFPGVAKIQEAQEGVNDTVVMAYGSFAPVTEEHIKLLKTVVASAQQAKGSNVVFIQPDRDFGHDDISLRHKAEVLKDAVKGINICMEEGLMDIFDAFVWLYNRHYQNVTVITGSNEIVSIEQILKENNGKETDAGFFEFKKYKVLSYGKDNPDNSKGAKDARNAILNGDLDAFMAAVQGPNLQYFTPIKKLYNVLRYELKNAIGAGGA